MTTEMKIVTTTSSMMKTMNLTHITNTDVTKRKNVRCFICQTEDFPAIWKKSQTQKWYNNDISPNWCNTGTIISTFRIPWPSHDQRCFWYIITPKIKYTMEQLIEYSLKENATYLSVRTVARFLIEYDWKVTILLLLKMCEYHFTFYCFF